MVSRQGTGCLGGTSRNKGVPKRSQCLFLGNQGVKGGTIMSSGEIEEHCIMGQLGHGVPWWQKCKIHSVGVLRLIGKQKS